MSMRVASIAKDSRFRTRVQSALGKDGVIKHAATELGVADRTLRRWIRKDPTLTEGVDLRGPGRPWLKKA